MHPGSIYSLSEKALVICFGDNIDLRIHKEVIHARRLLEEYPFPGYIESVPAYTTLTVYYDPAQFLLINNYGQEPVFEQLSAYLDRLLQQDFLPETNGGRLFHIPVCYGGEFGPDMMDVSKELKLTSEEIILLHSRVKYTVFMIGFVPGFAYLGELPEALSIGRRTTPRSKIIPGSVGIAGRQTGIYPIEIPGGWQLIGRTPLSLFDLNRPNPVLLSAGDEVIFDPISPEEFNHLKSLAR